MQQVIIYCGDYEKCAKENGLIPIISQGKETDKEMVDLGYNFRHSSYFCNNYEFFLGLRIAHKEKCIKLTYIFYSNIYVDRLMIEFDEDSRYVGKGDFFNGVEDALDRLLQ